MSGSFEPKDSKIKKYERLSRKSAIALYLLSALWGGVQFVAPDIRGFSLLSTFLFALAAYCWAQYDSIARAKPMLPVLQMLYFLTWPIGSLVYLVFRSGWKGVGIWLLHLLGLLGVSIFTQYAILLAMLLLS